MAEVFVLVEHRRGELRDITFEMLSGCRDLAKNLNASITAVLLGKNIDNFVEQLKSWADKILVVEDDKLENFNAEAYQRVLSHLIKERKPILTLIGHTSFGMDLAPALAAELGIPLATDCIGFELQDGRLVAIRQMYGGKVNARISFKTAPYMATIRSAAFKAEEPGLSAEVEKAPSPLTEEITTKRFLEYVEAAVGEVDITQAERIVAVGRGVGDYSDEKVRSIIEELANELGAVIACSRPIVDKGWLPKDRQVGTSGKTVKPKLYLALGISGAFQHVAGMSASETIVAVNKDPKAPIFTVADYGIVDDLFKVVPVLTEKVREAKGGS
ncbi:electron transfer flavoprotein subunit alpha/FixB family protein [Candidatus Alkanophaga liquidiphilum]|nr:Electron transfer flavoprotein [Candidatus Alkanophaga liquidiphilum]RLG38309.1 MAG: electron transfer flavoprotein subunit alpha/FixB family protein [Candidatus Alkanophagales archaeon]